MSAAMLTMVAGRIAAPLLANADENDTAGSTLDSSSVVLPTLLYASPNIAGQGSAESIPDGKYYDENGNPVADKLDIDANGNKVYSLNGVELRDENGNPIAIEFSRFENNAPDLLDLVAFLNIALSGADPTNYAVYSDEFFKKQGQYCDEGTFSLTGTANPNTTLGLPDVVQFLKYFGAPSRSLVVPELAAKVEVYEAILAQLGDKATDAQKAYLVSLKALKDTLMVTGVSVEQREKDAKAEILVKLQEYAVANGLTDDELKDLLGVLATNPSEVFPEVDDDADGDDDSDTDDDDGDDDDDSDTDDDDGDGDADTDSDCDGCYDDNGDGKCDNPACGDTDGNGICDNPACDSDSDSDCDCDQMTIDADFIL
jgi:hypothetical protein